MSCDFGHFSSAESMLVGGEKNYIVLDQVMESGRVFLIGLQVVRYPMIFAKERQIFTLVLEN